MKHTVSYEVDVCDLCGFERMGKVACCIVCSKEQCAGCTPMGRVGLEPPMSHDAALTFPTLRNDVCFDCAPDVAVRVAALFPEGEDVSKLEEATP